MRTHVYLRLPQYFGRKDTFVIIESAIQTFWKTLPYIVNFCLDNVEARNHIHSSHNVYLFLFII
jgi:hypothetical protein